MEIQSRRQLPELMRRLNLPMVACELGIAEGLTSLAFLSNGVDKLYMVDIWMSFNQSGDAASPQSWHDKNLLEAKERVEPFGDSAIFLRGFTKDMAVKIPDKSLGMVYIDAHHTYESVMMDLKYYYPKVVDGGIVSGHDIGNPQYGVKQAVDEFCKDRFEVHIIPEDEVLNSSFWFIKK